MSTYIEHAKTTTHEIPSVEQRTALPWRILRQTGVWLFMLLLILFMLITALPVILLYFVTAVPFVVTSGLLLVDLGIIFALFYFERSGITVASAVAGFFIVAGLAVIASQAYASTPPITDENGNEIPGSIAELETVELNGSEQWVTIRGYDEDNPVLLFLAGGPGGSELVMTRKYLGEMEKHFVVVNWDQPGTGKSYNAVDADDITPERYIEDAHALTLYLRERFDKEKIYILGESWGSILGIWLVQEYPELYYAFVSTGQMVDVRENDLIGYEFMIEHLTEKGRNEKAEKLRQNGPPPYTGNGMAMRYFDLFGEQYNYMMERAHGEDTGQNLFFDSLQAEEYGLLDKANLVRGIIKVFTNLYPQIVDVDFRTQATQLDVPVYFIKGEWDINAVNSLTVEYFELLEAPHKELIWFEDSGHTPLWEEPARFTDVMVNTVLAETYPEQ